MMAHPMIARDREDRATIARAMRGAHIDVLDTVLGAAARARFEVTRFGFVTARATLVTDAGGVTMQSFPSDHALAEIATWVAPRAKAGTALVVLGAGREPDGALLALVRIERFTHEPLSWSAPISARTLGAFSPSTWAIAPLLPAARTVFS